jgi:hypothetical protein
MHSRLNPSDGETRPSPRCRDTLVFSSRYPVLSVGMALSRSGADVHQIRSVAYAVA